MIPRACDLRCAGGGWWPHQLISLYMCSPMKIDFIVRLSLIRLCHRHLLGAILADRKGIRNLGKTYVTRKLNSTTSRTNFLSTSKKKHSSIHCLQLRANISFALFLLYYFHSFVSTNLADRLQFSLSSKLYQDNWAIYVFIVLELHWYAPFASSPYKRSDIFSFPASLALLNN